MEVPTFLQINLYSDMLRTIWLNCKTSVWSENMGVWCIEFKAQNYQQHPQTPKIISSNTLLVIVCGCAL